MNKMTWGAVGCLAALLLTAGCGARTEAGRTHITSFESNGVHDNAWYDTSPALARTLTEDGLVSAAQVVTTDKNIYVALQLDDPNRVPEYWTDRSQLPIPFQEEIASRVQTNAAPRVRKVFISTNGTFYQQLELMAKGSPDGYPMNLEKFNSMTAGIFQFNPTTLQGRVGDPIIPDSAGNVSLPR
jgi:hypothetical protein